MPRIADDNERDSEEIQESHEKPVKHFRAIEKDVENPGNVRKPIRKKRKFIPHKKSLKIPLTDQTERLNVVPGTDGARRMGRKTVGGAVDGRVGIGKNVRTEEQREIDQIQILKMIRRGYTKQQIADRMDLSLPTVQKDYKEVMQQLTKLKESDADHIRRSLLEQYSEVKREAWKAWEESKRPAQKRTAEGQFVVGGKEKDKEKEEGEIDISEDPAAYKKRRKEAARERNQKDRDGHFDKAPTLTEMLMTEQIGRIKIVETEEGQTGDPRYLSIVTTSLKAERELQGVDMEVDNTQDRIIRLDWDGLFKAAERSSKEERLGDGTKVRLDGTVVEMPKILGDKDEEGDPIEEVVDQSEASKQIEEGSKTDLESESEDKPTLKSDKRLYYDKASDSFVEERPKTDSHSSQKPKEDKPKKPKKGKK